MKIILDKIIYWRRNSKLITVTLRSYPAIKQPEMQAECKKS